MRPTQSLSLRGVSTTRIQTIGFSFTLETTGSARTMRQQRKSVSSRTIRIIGISSGRAGTAVPWKNVRRSGEFLKTRFAVKPLGFRLTANTRLKPLLRTPRRKQCAGLVKNHSPSAFGEHRQAEKHSPSAIVWPRSVRSASGFDSFNFGSKNKIVFAQTTNRVRYQLDSNVSIAGQVKVGMVLVLFRNGPNLVAELESLKEV